MIFVTVGSQLSFDRLLDAVEMWVLARRASQPEDGVDVFAQVGEDGSEPAHVECVESLEPAEFEARVAAATIVVGHAGTGTIMAALMAGKPVVCLARREALGETRNDHQVATLERLADRAGIFGTTDESQLGPLIDQALKYAASSQAPDGQSSTVDLGTGASAQLTDRLRTFLDRYIAREQ